MKKYSIGVDIGGSHISCALVDLQKGVILKETISEADIDKHGSANEILSGWATVLKQSISFIKKDELAGIGIGMPGPFEYHNGIGRFEKVEKFYGLNGINVADQLSKLLDFSLDTPIRFMNDASAFAVGEAWLGSAMNFKNSVSITLGTGFGSAFVSEEIPVVNGDSVPQLGCAWHLPYKKGIADDYFSTRWFIRRYKEETGVLADGAKAIADEAKNNSVAKAIFEEYGRNMGEFFSPWFIKFSANVLVIGGNVAGAYHLFGPSFEFALRAEGVKTEIKLSGLKEYAAILGSARLLDNNYWKRIEPILPFM